MRTSYRWVIPTAVTATITAGALVVPQLASADPELEPTTAAELLVDLATAPDQPFSGTVVQSTDLGLPELPTGPGDSGDLTTLLAGRTMMRVWSDGPERSRIAVMGSLSETDVVRDGRDLWLWESEGNTATHVTLPEADETAAEAAEAQAAREQMMAGNPQMFAEQALAAIDPTTAVSIDGAASVAGRDAYELVLEPRDDASLIGSVRIAVDAATSLPLRVQVTARGATEPAYETGFTKVSFDTPGDEVFQFAPPAGAEVTEQSLEGMDAGQNARTQDAGAAHAGAVHADVMPTVLGEGWTTVVVLEGVDAAQVGEAAGGDGIAEALLGGFQPVSGDFGSGRMLTTSLVSALWLDDGRLLVGAVTPAELEAAAVAAVPLPVPVP